MKTKDILLNKLNPKVKLCNNCGTPFVITSLTSKIICSKCMVKVRRTTLKREMSDNYLDYDKEYLEQFWPMYINEFHCQSCAKQRGERSVPVNQINKAMYQCINCHMVNKLCASTALIWLEDTSCNFQSIMMKCRHLRYPFNRCSILLIDILLRLKLASRYYQLSINLVDHHYRAYWITAILKKYKQYPGYLLFIAPILIYALTRAQIYIWMNQYDNTRHDRRRSRDI